ncbi:AMP-binding protein [Parachitinimonas caeni]|uniref:AMP-binding protein n=1 Tax=Parachitinimonas caeni TaxID=3031301 RepID=A0ABT7DTR2_9NEIS|nr:AMP-binding protein [Parachitinimonas caeni]MDK2123466.1 AMP-binding protein [Parachitinimonas caeni]
MSLQTFALSRSQQAVFKMEAFQLSGHRFYLGGVARLTGEVSLAQLAQAGAIVRDTLDVFRIGFVANAAGDCWHGVRHGQLPAHIAQIEQIDFSRHADPDLAFARWAERQLLLDEDLSLAPMRIFAVRYRENQAGWFVKAHHAAADGAALALMMEHLSSALALGHCVADAPEFTVLAERECDYEQSPRCAKDAEYWHALFGDHAGAAPIPVHSRSPIGDYRGQQARSLRIRFELTDAHQQTLARFKQQGGSLFRLFCAATAYSQMVIEDGDGVLLQAPMLNRWDEAEKRAVGMAVAPALFPVSRAAGESVADCYQTLRKTLQKAVVHSRFAPGARWGELASPAWRQVVPAFGVSYQTGAFEKSVCGAEVEIDHLQAVEALFATLHIHDRFDGGHFRLEADFRQQWSPAQCHAFLASVVDHAMQAAAAVLDSSDAQLIEPDVEPVAPIGPQLRTAFQRFADRCLIKPAAGHALTYAEGQAWIASFLTRLASHRAAGSRAPVLLLGRRLPETTLAYLACLIGQVTVVPVCPTTPHARLATIARNSGAALCIHAAADQTLAESLGLPLLPVALEAAAPAALPEPDADQGQPAYILYTSGSTGEPKGVAISPSALAYYALAATDAYAADCPFSAPLFTSFGFDLTQTSLLVPVLSGGFIQPWEQDIRDEPSMLQALLADEALSGVKCTPAHLALLTEHARPRRNPLTFVVGGENLLAGLVNQSLSVFPAGSRIINEYGPTETTVGCCIHTVSHPHNAGLDAGQITPIGEALGTAVMSIRDSVGRPVPQGFKGEIWIGGPVLADGYIHNPAQTAAKFVTGPDGHSRWYRTGDLGVQDAQGVFHCLGRIDDEFKLRGFRIHPSEIEKAVEAALSRSRGLGQRCELKALKLALAGQETVVLCSSETVPAGQPDFIETLHALLPEAWRPGRYCVVQPWPVNANGKVDAAALAAAVRAVLASDGGVAAATDATTPARRYQLPAWLDAAFLQPIWPDAIDWQRSFLELGGDSIKAIRLAALLAKQGVRISAAELLTSKSLGAVLEAACAAVANVAPAVTADPDEIDPAWIAHLPASRWFRQQPFQDRNHLQQGVTLTLPVTLPAERIHAAVEAVKARHRIFALRADAGTEGWHFATSAGQSLRRYTLSGNEPLAERMHQLQREICLQTQPSLHEVVLTPGAATQQLIWVCHHLLCDVHSWIYLLDELDQALEAGDVGTDRMTEHGAFLWGKWLHDQRPDTTPHAVQPAQARTGVTTSRTLSLRSSDFTALGQRLKAERSELIAASLLALLHEDQTLPAQATVLFENHGRLFAEAEVSFGLAVSLTHAVGWFTGFNALRLTADSAGQGWLHALKVQRHQLGADWARQLGLPMPQDFPLLCINDIGLGLASQTAWRHFTLDPALSGGFRHSAEAVSADFDLLISDGAGADSGLVSVQLTVAGPDTLAAARYLKRLDVRLQALRDAVHGGQPDAVLQQALLPADFPHCQLSQSELDLILHGATA